MEEQLNQLVTSHSILVFGDSNEIETQLSVNIIKNAGASYHLLDMSHESNREDWIAALENRVSKNNLPLIFISGEFFGGYFELKHSEKEGELIPRLCSSGIPNNSMPKENLEAPKKDTNNYDDDDLFGSLLD